MGVTARAAGRPPPCEVTGDWDVRHTPVSGTQATAATSGPKSASSSSTDA
jgi:hypothetical protein